MYLDVIDLRDFYGTLLGRLVARSIGQAMVGLGRPQPSARVLGFGFATPYLGGLRGSVEWVLAFMPSGQGVIDWPPDGPSATALVPEEYLPLPDASIDWVFLVHSLEMSPRPQALMEEMRRVLAAGGQLVVVVPNRQGPWARSDLSPFGFGRPYSRGQLKSLFAAAGFEAEGWATALHMPPTTRRSLLGPAMALEKAGANLWPAFAGVTCVRAAKRTVQFLTAKRRPVPAPAFRPALRPGLAGRSAP